MTNRYQFHNIINEITRLPAQVMTSTDGHMLNANLVLLQKALVWPSSRTLFSLIGHAKVPQQAKEWPSYLTRILHSYITYKVFQMAISHDLKNKIKVIRIYYPKNPSDELYQESTSKWFGYDDALIQELCAAKDWIVVTQHWEIC